MSLKEFFKSIYYRNTLIENTEIKLDEFNAVLNALKNPKRPEYIKEKSKSFRKCKWFYDGRNMIINAFKDKIFTLYHESRLKDKDKGEDVIRDKNGLINCQKLDRLFFKRKRHKWWTS